MIIKTLIATLLLLLITATLPVSASRAAGSGASNGTSETVLPVSSSIKVYFVSGMFSAQQRKALWEAMKGWQSLRKVRGAEISFVDFGETGGLIDCQSCLTVVREELFMSKSKKRSSFNTLRHDGTGRWASAWIGLDRNTTTITDLRTLMTRALDLGLGR